MLRGFDSRRLHFSCKWTYFRRELNTDAIPTSASATLDGVSHAARRHEGPADEQSVTERLRDRSFRAEVKRLYTEMVEARAPAVEGPIVNAGRPRRGRLVFGDAAE
jgi:hypothetical protein